MRSSNALSRKSIAAWNCLTKINNYISSYWLLNYILLSSNSSGECTNSVEMKPKSFHFIRCEYALTSGLSICIYLFLRQRARYVLFLSFAIYDCVAHGG